MSRTLKDALHDALSKQKKEKPPTKTRPEAQLVGTTTFKARKKSTKNTDKTPDIPQGGEPEPSFQDSMQLQGVEPTRFKNVRGVEKKTGISRVEPPAPEKPCQEKKTPVPLVKKAVSNGTMPPPKPKAARQPLDRQPAAAKKIPPKKPAAKVVQETPKPPQEPYSVQVTDSEILPNPQLTGGARWNGYLAPKQLGAREQIASTPHDDEREVVIGLDFGTAYTKVVIGDSALGKAFAVPFADHVGLPAYLLPSRVWLDGEQYALLERGEAKQRLKLNLIEQDRDADCYLDTAAFLALVIRHARGWLFSTQAAIYKNTRILWKLTLGLPAATYEHAATVEKFRDAAEAAWVIAKHRRAEISRDLVLRVCEEIQRKKKDQAKDTADSGEVDFDVIPELSAQIYGFLMSSKFDPKARNCFLMVDIGAGTVDSSVFRVVRDKRRKWEFRFFSNVVRFNGVANLNDARIRFLTSAFKKIGMLDQHGASLSAASKSLDNINGIPDSLIDYFSGVKFTFSEELYDPDINFYKNRFKRQITNDTLKGAETFFSDNKAFKGMPLFLCGGGSRMQFFNRLENDLLSHKNASWFKFIPQNLEVPSMLSAKGVRETDFDRLSVAFGLSFLDVGKYVREQLKTTPAGTKTEDSRRCKWCGAIGTCYCD